MVNIEEPMRRGALLIKDHPLNVIEIACEKCNRRGRYRRSSLLEKYGPTMVLPDILAELSANCDLRDSVGNEGCGAYYPALDPERAG